MGRQVPLIERVDDVFDSRSVLRVLRTTTFLFPRCDDSVGNQSFPLIVEPPAPNLSDFWVSTRIYKFQQLTLYLRRNPISGRASNGKSVFANPAMSTGSRSLSLPLVGLTVSSFSQ